MKHGRNPVRLLGLPYQMHARLFRSLSALPMVALEAAGHDIGPGLTASFYRRDDVIKGQIFGRASVSAVLAGVPVSGIDVRPAEFHMSKALPHTHIFEQAQHARHPDREADAADLSIIFCQNLHLPLAEQGNGPFPWNDIDRFVAGV